MVRVAQLPSVSLPSAVPPAGRVKERRGGAGPVSADCMGEALPCMPVSGMPRTCLPGAQESGVGLSDPD